MAKLLRSIVVSLLVGATAARAAAQCCGDCNGDGTVTINELVTAVNNALDACGAATPTPAKTPTPTHRPTVTHTPNGCPFTLTDNSGSSACGFSGTYNRGCGSALNSALFTNGVELTVEIATMVTVGTPIVFFGAMVDTATSAHLLAWSTDGFQNDIRPLSGSVQLADGGNQLTVFPNDSPFMIMGCGFVEYIGTYIGSAGASALRTSVALAEDPGAALDRLRAWHEQPIPDLGMP